jgi:hypothetical protein
MPGPVLVLFVMPEARFLPLRLRLRQPLAQKRARPKAKI